MKKDWLVLVIIGLITLLGYIGYQFYMSLTGENVTARSVTAIRGDLGTDIFEGIVVLDANSPVRDEALDNK